MIMACTSLKIKSGDGLPEAICVQCVNYLGTSYNFNQRCEKTDRNLRELINLLKDNKKTNISDEEDLNDSVSLDFVDIEIKEEINEVHDSKLNAQNLENNATNSGIVKDGNSILINENSKENKITDKQNRSKKCTIPKKNKSRCERENLSCKFCFKQFTSEIKLKSHIITCLKQPTHCELCSTDFPDKTILKEHQVKIHSIETNINEDQNTCNICDSTFPDHNKLLFHYRNHIGVAAYFQDKIDDDKTLTCCYCNQHFPKIFDLESHLSNHKTERPKFICKLCTFETIEEQSIKTHLKKHRLGPLVCSICLLSFISDRKLRLHVKSHRKVNKSKYTCLICEKIIPSRDEIKTHIVVHMEDLHSCGKCSKSFQNASEYKSHRSQHAKPALCTICGKLFPAKYFLDSHMLIHNGLKPFSCKICQQSFRTKDFLRGHQRVHSDVKPYVCTWCGNSFKRSTDLNTHNRIHTGARPYSCSYPGCNSTFKTSSFMSHHLKRHTGEAKVYTCEICSKIFSRSFALKRHMLIHNNERPHSCDVCGQCFRRSYHLKEHKTKAHNE